MEGPIQVRWGQPAPTGLTARSWPHWKAGALPEPKPWLMTPKQRPRGFCQNIQCARFLMSKLDRKQMGSRTCPESLEEHVKLKSAVLLASHCTDGLRGQVVIRTLSTALSTLWRGFLSWIPASVCPAFKSLCSRVS